MELIIAMPNISMKELAKKLNLSPITVSRAIKSPHLVKKSTRERILSAMKEYQYVYNAAAGELSSKRSNTIGIITPLMDNYVIAKSIDAFQKSLPEKYTLIIGSSDYNPETERMLLGKFLERNLAGLIVYGFSQGQEDLIERIQLQRLPCVILHEILKQSDISYVGYDNYKSAFKATELLIHLGHRRIGLIIGPFSIIGRIVKRYSGYKAALEQYGLAYDPNLVLERQPSHQEGKLAMASLLNLPDPPTAVFIAHDEMAIGAMAAVRERGLSVPNDVSIVGFDDIPTAAFCDPPLTTNKIPAEQMGSLAAKALVDLIDNGIDHARQFELEVELIVRESCVAYRRPKNN